MRDTLKLLITRLNHIITYSDLTTLRLGVIVCSILNGLLSFMPAAHLMHPSLQSYSDFPHYYAVLFLFYGIFALYSLLIPKSNRFFTVAIPILGALIWTSSATLMIQTFNSQGLFLAPVLSTHFLTALCSWWLVTRIEHGK